VSASAEIYVADLVYNHVQHQSLAFHLSRETGKVIRIVSRGSQSFSAILRYTCFSLLPIILELSFVMGVIGFIYPWEFVACTFASVVLYIFVTVMITEWRAKHFKSMAQKDTEYNQKATDSLLNFETVKYFNAEKHEENRFLEALGEYKSKNIIVANSLVVLNITQALIIALGLTGSLFLAYYQISDHTLQIGDFVMINTYILQMYAPLGFLGTFWRFIRQAMVDVEMVFELLEVDEKIKEVEHPIDIDVQKGEIEFRNVTFTYDKKLPEEEQRMIIKDLSFKVPAGKSVAIVGSTGSGKSTIMRLLYRFYDVMSGSILIDGQDISQMRLIDLR
jgi:ABC-type transport system involved in Fe-S cluster assembly fused permease/ATPase subunit